MTEPLLKLDNVTVEFPTRRGVLRGLHFQTRKPQGKLMRCVAGEIFDVAVDIRRDIAGRVIPM